MPNVAQAAYSGKDGRTEAEAARIRSELMGLQGEPHMRLRRIRRSPALCFHGAGKGIGSKVFEMNSVRKQILAAMGGVAVITASASVKATVE
jgi:hypothetical protein